MGSFLFISFLFLSFASLSEQSFLFYHPRFGQATLHRTKCWSTGQYLNCISPEMAESQILPPFHSLSSILTDDDIVTGPQLLLGMLSNPNLKRTPRAWASSNEAISNENAVYENTGRLGVRNVLDNILRNISPTIETNNLLSRSTRKDSKRARNDWNHRNHSCYWNPLTCIRKRSS